MNRILEKGETPRSIGQLSVTQYYLVAPFLSIASLDFLRARKEIVRGLQEWKGNESRMKNLLRWNPSPLSDVPMKE